jgi:F-type H+-transporting ATPase subunit epsilon
MDDKNLEKDAPRKLSIKVFSPYETFYQGPAKSLSAANRIGPFDILFGHSNFFTLLSPGYVRINTGYDSITIEINSGILRVKNNQITLFANAV